MSLKVEVTLDEERNCHKITVWHGEEPVREEWDDFSPCFLTTMSWVKDAIMEAYDFGGEDAT